MPRERVPAKVAYTLTIPPSANHLWRHRRGRRVDLTPHYKAWRDLNTVVVRCAGVVRIEGPARVTITVVGGYDFPATRDLDNCLKPVLDLVRSVGVLSDDTVREVTEVIARYEPPDGNPARCLVEVETLEEGH